MWVCDYCGTEEVDEKAWVNMNTGEITEPDDYTNYWCNNCNDEVSPMYYHEWQEKIIEEYRERQYYKKPSEIAREEYFRRLAEIEKQKRKEKEENNR